MNTGGLPTPKVVKLARTANQAVWTAKQRQRTYPDVLVMPEDQKFIEEDQSKVMWWYDELRTRCLESFKLPRDVVREERSFPAIDLEANEAMKRIFEVQEVKLHSDLVEFSIASQRRYDEARIREEERIEEERKLTQKKKVHKRAGWKF
jgi:hypothetical protein